MADNWQNTGFSQQQWTALQSLMRGATGTAGPPGPPGPSGPQGTPGSQGTPAAGNGNTNRWNAGEVGFFDPMYDGKSAATGEPIEHTGKNTYFRDVSYFIDRIKDMTEVKKAEIVRQNLYICFRGTALAWYTTILTEDQKRLVKLSNGVDEWARVLHKRFKESTSSAMTTITKKRYTMNDARRKREPMKYAHIITRTAKATDMIVTAQIFLIFNGLDLKFRRDLSKITDNTTMKTFFQDMKDNKEIWWDLGARNRSSHNIGYSTNRSGNSFRPSGQQGSYNFNSSSGNNRPDGTGGSGGSLSQPRGYGSGYGYPFFGSQPRLTQYPTTYQFNQNRAYQNQSNQSDYRQQSQPPAAEVASQFERSQSQLVTQQYRPAEPTQLITSVRSAENASGFQPKFVQQQQQYRSAAGGYQNQYFDYQNQNQYRQPFGQRSNSSAQFGGRAYMAEDEEHHEDDQAVDTHDENHESWSAVDEQSAEDSYHEHAYHGSNRRSDSPFDDDGEVRSFFTTARESRFTCHRCNEEFSFNNKLHYHVRRCKVKPATAAEASCNLAAAGASRIIRSSVSPDAAPGSGFRSWRYAQLTANINFKNSDQLVKICSDIGAGPSLDDREFITKQISNYADRIVRRSKALKINDIESTAVTTNECISVDFSIPGEANGKPATACFTRYVYLVNDLKANILLDNDILGPKDIVLHVEKGKLTIDSCGDFSAPLSVVAKDDVRVKRTIRAQANVIISAHSCFAIPIKLRESKLSDRDMLFNSDHIERLDKEDEVFVHLVDSNFFFVQARNTIDQSIVITRSERLGTLNEYEKDGCYLADPEVRHLAAESWIRKALKLDVAALAAFGGAVTGMAKTASSTTVTSPFVSSVSTLPSAPSIGMSVILEQPNLHQEYTTSFDITVYGIDSTVKIIAVVAEDFLNLWQNDGFTVRLPPEEWMPINLQPDAKVTSFKVYPLEQADKDLIDQQFDELQRQSKLEFTTQPTPFSYSVFVVWRIVHRPNGLPPERKGRVVVDIRGLNKITELDTYFMPLQADVTALVAGCPYISVFDAASFFYQWLVRIADRHKLTVVFHRRQKQFNVAVMGFKNSPAYVQRKIDAILRVYRAFAKAYVDDIVVFSRTLKEHLDHLRQVFQLLNSYDIRLSLKKSFLGYSIVALLGQKVDAFGLTIAADKLAAIANLKFPYTLKDLEGYLGLTGWLRNYIAWYAQKSDPLQRRKTLLLRSFPANKGRQRKIYSARTVVEKPSAVELDSYRQLQEAFSKAKLLVHHDPTRTTYVDVDASKRRGFGVVIYHLKPGADPNNPKASEIEPIMFLSRMLTSAEERYWPTELEMAGLVWVVRRARHLIEASKHVTVIFTNHAANAFIARQTTLSSSNTDKLNLRLVRASTYLSQFRLDIRYRSGKRHVIPDALFRLSADRSFLDDGENLELESYHSSMADPSVNDQCFAYHGALISMSSDFHKQLVDGYVKEKVWTGLITMLISLNKRLMLEKPFAVASSDEASGSPPSIDGNSSREASPSEGNSSQPKKSYIGIDFELDDGLIYHTGKGRRRLCIPASCEAEVFRMSHDDNQHAGRHRCYQRIADSLYVPRLSRKLRQYLDHCPSCQLNQTKRHKPYEELMPISSTPRPFHTIAIDFVVGLPGVYDALMTITDKFSRRTLLIRGKTTYTAADWTHLLLNALLTADWDIPEGIISDRNPKFLSDLWQAIFTKIGTRLLTSTAYHLQTDGSSERTNQTVEIALRFLITMFPDVEWSTFLPALQAQLNNSPNTATGLAPNEIVYGFKTRELIAAVSAKADNIPDNILDRRLKYQREAADATAFAQAKAKIYYDARHQPILFHPGDKVYLRLHHEYQLPDRSNRKMSNQRCEPFTVKRRAGRLAYELELPAHWRIHPIISVAQLEPCPSQPDSYSRSRSDYPASVEVEGDIDDWKSYTVERIVNKRLRKFGRITVTQYMVKWSGYGPEFNEWRSLSYLNNCMKLVEEYEVRQEHTSEDLPDIPPFPASASASSTPATSADKPVSTKNETQSAAESVKRGRDRSSTKPVAESAKRRRGRVKKEARS